jgi:hydroxymethylpyrimidine/phosphomethylpyrimidine kinase
VPEAKFLSGNEDAKRGAEQLSKFCNVYLKGGHSQTKPGYDHLFLKDNKRFSFRPKLKDLEGKHGSGCVLSSAITANLARGENLHRSCWKAKEYTERFLSSTDTLIGYHKI